MEVDDILALAVDEVGPLRSPIMLVGLAGLFDIGGAATTALERLGPPDVALTIGEIDPDPFFDFTQARPYVVIEDGVRQIQWPQNRIDVVRTDRRDLIIVVGTEPHLYWRTFSDCLITAVAALACEVVVTVGSFADAVPHTRPPLVTASTTDRRLGRALGIGGPTYEGATGLAGVLQVALSECNIPSVSVRVGVPHYLMNTDQPAAVYALERHLVNVLGLPPRDLDDDDRCELDSAQQLHDELVASDDELGEYVDLLEAEYDRTADSRLPTADQLGSQFEAFLGIIESDVEGDQPDEDEPIDPPDR